MSQNEIYDAVADECVCIETEGYGLADTTKTLCGAWGISAACVWFDEYRNGQIMQKMAILEAHGTGNGGKGTKRLFGKGLFDEL